MMRRSIVNGVPYERWDFSPPILSALPGTPRPAAVAQAASSLVLRSRPWFTWASPADDQGDASSCTCNALCGNAEVLYRFAGQPWPAGGQLDAYSIWAKRRKADYGDLRGGLMPESALDQCIKDRVFPPGTAGRRIAASQVRDYLASEGPVSVVHLMTYSSADADLVTGYWDPEMDSRPLGLHMQLCLGVFEQVFDGVTHCFYFGAGSWGAKWGAKGFWLMHERRFMSYLRGDPMIVELGPGWETYDGWRGKLLRA